MGERKPILSLDFDGVIHSYTSGWQGALVIPDPPVPGALQFIVEAMEWFEVNIFSSRSKGEHGRRAMEQWLLYWYKELARDPDQVPAWLEPWVAFAREGGMWGAGVHYAIRKLVDEIKFPLTKPAAFLTIDDRAVRFEGVFPDPKALLGFKPWNKREVADG